MIFIKFRQPSFAILIIGLILILPLTGCSKKSTGVTTTQTTASQPAEDFFPGIDRSQPVEPAMTTGATFNPDTSAPSQETVKTNLKIGGTTQIRASRYNLSGLVRIVSTTSVSLENFSYDGQCDGFTLYLTRSNNPLLEVVPFNLANRLYSNDTKSINFPSGITIDNVDSVAMMCNNYDEPLFVDPLEQ